MKAAWSVAALCAAGCVNTEGTGMAAPDASSSEDAATTLDSGLIVNDARVEPQDAGAADASPADASPEDAAIAPADDGAAPNDANAGDDAGGCVDDDADGVCNETDVCAGGDDRLDGDGDGTPDACESCDYPLVPRDSGCETVKVLVLDDGGDSDLVTLLNAAGFDATDGGVYHMWNAATLPLAGFDTVLWLEGKRYARSLVTGMDQELVDFVAGGGGLVRTEWGVWGGANPLSLGVLPVERVNGSFDVGSTWNVLLPQHPLAHDLPASFASAGSFTLVALRDGATAVVEDADGVPLLTYTTEHGGVTVHLNDDVLYTRSDMQDDPDVLQAYFNAVWFSAGAR